MLDGSEDKKCKGWQNGVFNSMTTENVCLAGRNNIEKWMSCEVVVIFEIYSEVINKIDLSSDDDKRVIMADGIHTLAYGHRNLIKL